jgi:hypothetical protein
MERWRKEARRSERERRKRETKALRIELLADCADAAIPSTAQL